MNQVTEEKKDAVTKTLAIVGFVAAILFAVWLAVQVVSVIPSAFTSLASLADGVYNYNGEDKLEVVNEKSVVNVDETFKITWNESVHDGDYSFKYDCTEGAAMSVRVRGEVVDLACGESINLGKTASIEVIATSEKQRFIDVPYTVTFITKDGGLSLETQSKITVVNASIPTTGLAEETDEENDMTETTPEPEVAGETTTPAPVVTTPAPKPVPEIIYAIPVSDPNGTTDLALTYIGVGILTNNNVFVKTATIGTNQTGAFQFAVTNLGTKTSDEWTYEADLPSGINYDSKDQKPLKPNEKAIITIGFDGITKTGSETFGAKIKTKSDTNSSNNSFTWAVTIVK